MVSKWASQQSVQCERRPKLTQNRIFPEKNRIFASKIIFSHFFLQDSVKHANAANFTLRDPRGTAKNRFWDFFQFLRDFGNCNFGKFRQILGDFEKFSLRNDHFSSFSTKIHWNQYAWKKIIFFKNSKKKPNFHLFYPFFQKFQQNIKYFPTVRARAKGAFVHGLWPLYTHN